MRYKKLGRTGLEVSELGFGCGAVGGLMVRGDRQEMVRTVARAIDAGINYFDTAESYGSGRSESNLGSVLKEMDADVHVGTKVQLSGADLDSIESAIVEHVEASLGRLDMDRVDMIYLHNSLTPTRQAESNRVTVSDVEEAAGALQSLVDQGKARFWGINGLGETESVTQAVDSSHPFAIQACCNLLNPTGIEQAPAGFPFQDYEGLIDKAAEQEIGVVAIRVLAAGALSGRLDRHEVAAQSVSPIATGGDYAEDAARAVAFNGLVEDGVVGSLVEAAIRFGISSDKISTALVGISSYEQLDEAVAHCENGSLPESAMQSIREIWAGFGTSGV